MTIREMTLEQLRDWHAKREGWVVLAHNDEGAATAWINERFDGCPRTGRVMSIGTHPFPPTLDGAASAMPEGWIWSRADGSWKAYHNHRSTCKEVPDTGNEITDRYRLAALAREATKGNNEQA